MKEIYGTLVDIRRKVFAEVPPHVEYSLSTLGTKFQKVLNEIEIFGLDYISELNKINNLKNK